jgi:hypothetical protein
MQSGRMRYSLAVFRRGVIAGNPGGVARGDYAFVFKTRASLKQTPGTKLVEGGIAEDGKRASLRIYKSAQNLTITVADRVMLNPGTSMAYSGAQSWSIESVGEADVFHRFIDLVIMKKMGG